MGIDNGTEASMVDLVKEAIDEAHALLRVETNLARYEIRRDLSTIKVGAIALFLCSQLLSLGLSALLFAALLTLPSPSIAAVIIGFVFLAAAIGLGTFAYTKRPKVLQEIRQRVSTDLKALKDGLS
jgi:hypothetical protein